MMRKSLKKILQDEDIVFKALGGVSEVGATSYFIKWKGIKILIDAGKRNSGKKITPEYDEIDRKIDILFITHIHQDHVGSLMEYYDFFEIKNIIATKETKDSLWSILIDTKKFVNKNLLEYYSNKKINELISSIKTYRYNEEVLLKSMKGLKFTLIKTSHLIGSAGILLEDDDYKLFITSDFTESEKLFHPNTYFEPVYDKKIDTVITETTYGSNEESDEVLKETTLSNLEYYINKIFEGTEEFPEGGNILIPAFARGRTQEVILALLKLVKDNRIPFTSKIMVPFDPRFKEGKKGPLAQKLTINYLNKYKYILEEELESKIPEDFQKFVNEYLKVIDIWNNSEKFFEQSNQILIATPGMLGNYKEKSNEDIHPVMQLALDILESKRHGIIFVGYQSPATLGGKIYSLSYGEKLKYYNKTYVRNTPHIYKVSFPGHVSAKGLISLISKINPDNVILTHGDINSSRNIAKAIRDKNINVIVPEIEENIYLMDNKAKRFFSPHHKFSNVIISLDKELTGIEIKEENIFTSDKFNKLDIIKVSKYIIENYDPGNNHIELVIREQDEKSILYEKLEDEFTSAGFSVDIITINLDAKDKKYLLLELLEIISELALGFREKFRIFFAIKDSFYSLPYNIVAQLFNEEQYYVDNKLGVIKLPDLPIDLNINEYKNYRELKKLKRETILTDMGHNELVPSDYYELIDRIYYYKKGRKRGIKGKSLAELLVNQLPVYDKKSVLFKKDLFANKNHTLWGRVESVYDIKNYKAVEIITYIVNKLNEKIEEIEFTNYITNYDHHKYYGEVIAFEEGKIYYRMVLENGIQYMVIKLGFNVNVREAVKLIGQKKE